MGSIEVTWRSDARRSALMDPQPPAFVRVIALPQTSAGVGSVRALRIPARIRMKSCKKIAAAERLAARNGRTSPDTILLNSETSAGIAAWGRKTEVEGRRRRHGLLGAPAGG
jgi:hypothetical protein